MKQWWSLVLKWKKSRRRKHILHQQQAVLTDLAKCEVQLVTVMSRSCGQSWNVVSVCFLSLINQNKVISGQLWALATWDEHFTLFVVFYWTKKTCTLIDFKKYQTTGSWHDSRIEAINVCLYISNVSYTVKEDFVFNLINTKCRFFISKSVTFDLIDIVNSYYYHYKYFAFNWSSLEIDYFILFCPIRCFFLEIFYSFRFLLPPWMCLLFNLAPVLLVCSTF